MKKLSAASIIREFCEENGYGFHPNYSGREMGGDSCIGIRHADAAFDVAMKLVMHAVARFGEGITENFFYRFMGSRQDSTGHSTITYWPRIRAED
jgi:hypothetical protein